MASDEEGEVCDYFYDDDDAEEDAAAGLEEDSSPPPPPPHGADYWVSGPTQTPGSRG
jgi:ariadne-1